jgi:uncharacterized membrane protein YfcA
VSSIGAGDEVVLAAAGVLAGIVGTAGGITSLVSYPALLAVGIAARAASVANIVALVACWPGSALASQPELSGRAPWVARWCLVSGLGGAAGAALLLLTPGRTFARIVPLLVLIAALALLGEPRLTAWRRRNREDRDQMPVRGAPGRAERRAPRQLPLAQVLTLLPISVYNGYFGAGAGVMTLTVMLVLVEPNLPTANALKNMLIGSATFASALVFIASGSVAWSAVVPLAAGLLIGSTLGPRLARRLPAELLRVLVVLLGVALAVQLWVDPGF